MANHPISEITKRPLSRFDWGLLVVIVMIAFFARVLPQPRTVDDAFITFRYSRNIVNGDGFVYNPESKVLGTTTPFYTLGMAAIGGVLGEDYPWYALAINAIADTLSVGMLIILGYYLTQRYRAGLLIGAIWAIAPFSVTFAIGGMETSVHNLWMIAAWVAYLDGRKGGWVGAFVALGLLTRPDALIWAAPLMLHQLWSAWRQREKIGGLLSWLPYRDYVAGLILGLPWTLFAIAYFGSPFPHTVGTKAVVYQVDSIQAFLRLLQHYATPLHQHELLGVATGIAIGLFLFPALAMIGLRDMTRRHSAVLPILIYPWLYFVVFSFLNPLIFRWYLTPPLPAYYIAIIGGGAALLSAFQPYLKPQHLKVVMGGVSFAALFFTLSGWTLSPDHGSSTPAPKMAFHELELNYEQMAQRLVEEEGISRDTLIAAGDIGAVGFYSDATILDTIGLVTKNLDGYYDPEVQREIIAVDANYAIPPEMIFDRQPEYLVVMVDFISNGLRQDPRFVIQYGTEPLYRIKTDYYGGEMLVYKRQVDE